ncbi:MAG: hypothetical protein A3D92_04625 [Bacteroidetes bacterium RIFCSPHIGHO2_02_FULL_44_7]|nr:MAG: hypothetical protein A3D92_04625 [Bacteroidetes bacterium RIFCSPHIGHO2_02_FULL_44_7]
MKRIISILVISAVAISFSACEKVEGEGGSSSITGKIHAMVYDGAGNLLTEYDAEKEDVFIVYGGENTMYDDDIKTSYDGSFRFDYLEPGTYQIFVYEKCTNCPSGKKVVLREVEITEKKSTIDLGTIEIRK